MLQTQSGALLPASMAKGSTARAAFLACQALAAAGCAIYLGGLAATQAYCTPALLRPLLSNPKSRTSCASFFRNFW